MNFDQIYPVEELKSKFACPVNFKFYGIEKINEIANLEPECLFEIGANAWMHFIEAGGKINPQKLAEHFDSHNPFLFAVVEKTIKRKVLQNIVLIHAEVDDQNLERKFCGKLLLARTYPNNLHISDVEFSNPYKPVGISEKRYRYHEYRSLGLFSVLLKNITDLAEEWRISKITLSAASLDQVNYFKGHGFNIENTSFARGAVEANESIPMELICA